MKTKEAQLNVDQLNDHKGHLYFITIKVGQTYTYKSNLTLFILIALSHLIIPTLRHGFLGFPPHS